MRTWPRSRPTRTGSTAGWTGSTTHSTKYEERRADGPAIDPAHRRRRRRVSRLVPQALSREFEIVTAQSADEASRRLHFSVDAVLLDLRLNGGGDADRAGIRLLDAVREIRPIPVIIMTAYADVDA